MAEDKDIRQDDDVKGHEAEFVTKSEPPKSPESATARPGDEDDVEGHEMLAKTPEEGKKGAPGVEI